MRASPKEKRGCYTALKTQDAVQDQQPDQAQVSDAREDFRRAMSNAGLFFTGEIYADGKLHRFKADGDHDKNAWYVFHPGPLAAGAFGCWKRGFKENWCKRNDNLSQADLQCVPRRWQQADAKLKAETAARERRRGKLRLGYSRARRPVTSHSYLKARQVHSYGELKQYGDALVLPLRDAEGDLHSLQFIGVDGVKKFLRGGHVAGCFFTLADKRSGPLVICEGYATGASIHEATGHAVVCAMNSGNLPEAAIYLPMRCRSVGCDTASQTQSATQLTTQNSTAVQHDAVISVYDVAGNVIETHEHVGDFKRAVGSGPPTCACRSNSRIFSSSE